MHDRLLRALVVTACTVGMASLTGCGTDLGHGYGATFDYPSEPPLPAGAIVVAHAKGRDDDDPMRGREVVIDLGSSRRVDVVEYYRKRFPSTADWHQGAADPDVGSGHLLCLVNHADKRFDEYVELYPYSRGFKSAGPHRFLASISRLYVGPDGGKRTANRCGLAGIWFPSDL